MSKRNINFSKSTRYRNRKKASMMLLEALSSEDDNEG